MDEVFGQLVMQVERHEGDARAEANRHVHFSALPQNRQLDRIADHLVRAQVAVMRATKCQKRVNSEAGIAPEGNALAATIKDGA